jgi:hypothetical protein
MRKVGFISVMLLLLGLPLTGLCQSGNPPQGGGFALGGPGPQIALIPTNILNQVLSLAAPSFGYLPGAFIQLYNTCGCITVEQLTGSSYFVTYGGLGIQIIIDGNRSGPQSGGNLPNGTKR